MTNHYIFLNKKATQSVSQMFKFAKGYLHITFQKHINFTRQGISKILELK